MRACKKGGMMQEEDIVEGRDDAGGQYKREGNIEWRNDVETRTI